MPNIFIYYLELDINDINETVIINKEYLNECMFDEVIENDMLAPETFVQLAGVNPYSQPKSIRTLSRRNFVQNGL